MFDRKLTARGWGGVGPVLLVVGLLALSAPAASAQGTPTATVLDVPAPEECQVAPRPFPLFPVGIGQRAAATPAPIVTAPEEPFAPPAGEAADAETVAAVTATVREAVACRNAGDYPRAWALLTQDMIVALFGGPATVDPEVRTAVVEGPRPVPRARRLAVVSVSDVIKLPDGRVGAVVDTRNARRAFRDYIVFELDLTTGRWLIDATEALPTPRG